jgi:cytochrome c oxidase subunit 2
VGRLIAGLFLLSLTGVALAGPEYGLNFQRPVSPVGHEVLELHNLILMVCIAIFIIVFSIMFYSIIVHRKSRGFKAAKFHDNTTLEVVWTVIPFVILIGMAIPSTAALLKMDDTSKSELTLKITGYQWKWEYEYPEQGIKFFSTLATTQDQINNKADKGDNYLLEVDNEVVLPVGKKIRLLVTANDVNHAWWVPQLATKKDAIPGFVNELWTQVEEPGVYRGQCAELCGKDHGFMPIVVRAVDENEFKAWANKKKGEMVASAAAAGKTWSKAELMAQGEKVYNTSCAACHGATGAGIPGVFPAMAGSKIAKGALDGHLDIVMNGKAGTAMTAFGKQLSDVDIAAVVTYERNAFGNNTGDVVQPSQVSAKR